MKKEVKRPAQAVSYVTTAISVRQFLNMTRVMRCPEMDSPGAPQACWRLCTPHGYAEYGSIPPAMLSARRVKDIVYYVVLRIVYGRCTT